MGRGSKHGIHLDEWEQRRTEFCARGQDLPQSKLMDLDVVAIRSAKRQRSPASSGCTSAASKRS